MTPPLTFHYPERSPAERRATLEHVSDLIDLEFRRPSAPLADGTLLPTRGGLPPLAVAVDVVAQEVRRHNPLLKKDLIAVIAPQLERFDAPGRPSVSVLSVLDDAAVKSPRYIGRTARLDEMRDVAREALAAYAQSCLEVLRVAEERRNTSSLLADSARLQQ